MFNMCLILSLLIVILEFIRGYVLEKYYNEYILRSGFIRYILFCE